MLRRFLLVQLVFPLVTATTLRFTFTRIRGVDTAVALGRLQLIDQFGTELDANELHGEPGNGWNGPEKLFDSTTATQWRDDTFASSAGTDGLSELDGHALARTTFANKYGDYGRSIRRRSAIRWRGPLPCRMCAASSRR